jgi:hypothetical protein
LQDDRRLVSRARAAFSAALNETDRRCGSDLSPATDSFRRRPRSTSSSTPAAGRAATTRQADERELTTMSIPATMRAHGIVVLAPTATGVSRVIEFHDPALVPVFGLPEVLLAAVGDLP